MFRDRTAVDRPTLSTHLVSRSGTRHYLASRAPFPFPIDDMSLRGAVYLDTLLAAAGFIKRLRGLDYIVNNCRLTSCGEVNDNALPLSSGGVEQW